MLASFVGTAEAVITRRFDYTKCPLYIFNFYLRYGQYQPSTERVRPHSWSMQEASSKVRVWRIWALSPILLGAKFNRGDSPLSFKGFFRASDRWRNDGPKNVFHSASEIRVCAFLHPFCRRCLASLYKETVKKPTLWFLKGSWQEESQRTSCEAIIYRIFKEGVKHVAFCAFRRRCW